MHGCSPCYQQHQHCGCAAQCAETEPPRPTLARRCSAAVVLMLHREEAREEHA